jgi:hypothetical protein
MEDQEFIERIRKLPLNDKMKLWSLELFMKRTPEKLIKGIRNILQLMYSYPIDRNFEMVDPNNHYAFKHKNKTKLDLLIENDRNEIIAEKINDFIERNYKREYRIDVGILFGDDHMPYIYEVLQKKGYKWRLEKQITVL